MLAPITREELDRYADWAYGLALDLTRSGYPTYADGIKSREDFIGRARKGMARENEEVLLFSADDQVCGWIHWFWLAEDQYAQAISFLTASHTEAALMEFVAHAAEKRPGYALHMGFPEDNARAIEGLRRGGFRLLEQSVHHELFFDRHPLPEVPREVSLLSGSDDEAAFRALHTATDLYWTAERILRERANWRVYLYRDGPRPTAALYARVSAGGWPEIFGIVGAADPTAYRALLIACLHDGKAAGASHMTYFEEDERMLPILAELGFEVISRYVCYQKTI